MNKGNEINELDVIKTDDESYPQVKSQELSIDNENKPNEINNLQNNKQKLSTAKRGRGRPRHLILATTQLEVYKLSRVGTRHEDIALLCGFSEDTLAKYYSKELAKGRIEANAAVAGTLYEKAKQGDTQAMMFWLKTRAQWSEKNTTELTGEGGAPINIKVITGID